MERISHYKRGGLSGFGVTALVVALLLTALSTGVLVLNLSRLNASRGEVARINMVLKQVADLHESPSAQRGLATALAMFMFSEATRSNSRVLT